MAKNAVTKAVKITKLITLKQLGAQFQDVAKSSHKALKECWASAHAIYMSVGADKDKQQVVKTEIRAVYTSAFTDEAGEYFGMTSGALANKMRKVCGLLADSTKASAQSKAKSRGSKGKGNRVTQVKKPTGGVATSRTATSSADKGATFRPAYWRTDIQSLLVNLDFVASQLLKCVNISKAETKSQHDAGKILQIAMLSVKKIMGADNKPHLISIDDVI
ncbi:MAG: hypothetical protein WCP53_12890 [Verrucomicrobiota bacterium]